MSDEKRIDRIERLVEENAKGIVELRLTVAENFSKALVDNAKDREDNAKARKDNAEAREKMLVDNAETRERMLVDNAETRERIRVDNAETREALHRGFAGLTRWMVAVSAVGGTFGGLVVVGTLLFPKIFGVG